MATFEFEVKEVKPAMALMSKNKLDDLKYHLNKKFLPSRVFREGKEIIQALPALVKNGVTYKISSFVNKREIDEFSKVLNEIHITHSITSKTGGYWLTIRKKSVEKIPAKKFDTNLLDL